MAKPVIEFGIRPLNKEERDMLKVLKVAKNINTSKVASQVSFLRKRTALQGYNHLDVRISMFLTYLSGGNLARMLMLLHTVAKDAVGKTLDFNTMVNTTFAAGVPSEQAYADAWAKEGPSAYDVQVWTYAAKEEQSA